MCWRFLCGIGHIWLMPLHQHMHLKFSFFKSKRTAIWTSELRLATGAGAQSDEIKTFLTNCDCLALIRTIQSLLPCIEGTSLKVQTGHNPRKWMLTCNAPNRMLMRWILRSDQFDNEIIYCPSFDHQVPDAFSRLLYPLDTNDWQTIHEKISQFAFSLATM